MVNDTKLNHVQYAKKTEQITVETKVTKPVEKKTKVTEVEDVKTVKNKIWRKK